MSEPKAGEIWIASNGVSSYEVEIVCKGLFYRNSYGTPCPNLWTVKVDVPPVDLCKLGYWTVDRSELRRRLDPDFNTLITRLDEGVEA